MNPYKRVRPDRKTNHKMNMNPLSNEDLRARFAALHADARPVANPLLTVAQLGEQPMLDLVLGNTLAVTWKGFILPPHALQIADRGGQY